jgi:hypothetical protein
MVTRPLVVLLALALAACGSKSSPAQGGSSTPSASASAATQKVGPATFEILRVADDVDAFPQDTSDLPKGGSLLNENIPAGLEKRVIPKELVDQICDQKVDGQTIHCDKNGDETSVAVPISLARNFVRVVALEGESLDDTKARVLAYAKARSLPAGARVVLGKLTETDPDTKKSVLVGFRTYVVRGDAELTRKDLTDAKVVEEGGVASVVVTLTPDGAAKFEKLTKESVMRRLALVIDGLVVSAPIVQGPITGGKLSIAMSAGEKSTDAEKDEAARLAKSLSGG